MKKLLFIACSLCTTAGILSMDPNNMNIHEATQSGNIEQVQAILNRDATLVDARDTNQNTPLHHAVTQGNLDIVKLLLEHNANILVRNNDHKSALDLAKTYGNNQIIKLLTYWPQYAHYRDKQLKAFDSQRKQLKLGNKVILIKDINDYLDELVRTDTIEEIENLVAHKIIHQVAADGYCRYVQSFLSVNPGLVNSLDDSGNTPLHWAAKNGHIEVVKLLLQHNAQHNIRNNQQETAYDCALSENHMEITQLLLDWPYYKQVRNGKPASRLQIRTFFMGKNSPDSPISNIPQYIIEDIVNFARPLHLRPTIDQLPDIETIHEIAERERAQERLREQQDGHPQKK